MLKAKVADTISDIQQGLMFVKDMPEDEGMIFIFAKSQNLNFWGMNTFIPLDIAFVDADNTIRKIAFIKPFCLDPIKSEEKCLMAIEANIGYFHDNSIAVGDKIKIDRGSFKEAAHITFVKTKDSSFNKGKIKQSQIADPTVNKPEQETVGQPIADEQTQDLPQDNLPVLDTSNIGQYLEDSFDDQDQDDVPGGDEAQPDQEQPEQDTDQYPVFNNVHEAAKWAEDNLEVVRINYTTKHGRALIRDVEPHGKFHSKSTSREILVTYDETVNGIRAFIAGNIGNWAFVGRKFQKKFVVKA